MDVTEMVGRCKRGDSGAMAALYMAYSGKMMNTLRRIVGTDAVAADLLHDGFIIVFTSIDSLRDASRLEPWMQRIMTNLALRYMQAGGKSVSLDHAGDVIDESGGEENPAEIPYDRIIQMVDTLPDGYRQVFRLSVLDGLSHNEIAGILGIAPRSSSSQLLRARRKLQSMIKAYRAGLITVFVLVVSTVAIIMFNGRRGRHVADVPVAKTGETAISHRADEKGAVEAKDTYLCKEESAVKPHVDSVMAAQAQCLPLPADTVLTAVNVPVDSVLVPFAATDDSVVIADADIRLVNVPVGGTEGWSFAMNTVAGQASESLLPRVFSLISHSIGSATRVDVETWEELTHYLTYDVGDGIDPLERDALLRIALVNEGRIYTRRSYGKPLQLGLSFSKRLTDRWSMDFGLRMTCHTTSLQTGGSDTNNISERQRTVFLGVPVGATYSFMGSGRWTLYGTAGVGLDIPLYGTAERRYNIGNKLVYSRKVRLDLPRWQWSVNAGVGIGYNITPHLQLYFSPKLTWYVPNGSQTTTQWNDKPLQLSLPVGIRIVFGNGD